MHHQTPDRRCTTPCKLALQRHSRRKNNRDKELLLLLLHPFNGLFFQDNLGKLAPERQTILDFTGVRDDAVAVALALSGPYANHLHLAPYR